ncbi:MAG TPA: hypothetical protein VLE72_02360 [Candidatus Saccharimonadales bacterium]|nr:hypothetical protein [Candidatus Saccharimonadales bacterium]
MTQVLVKGSEPACRRIMPKLGTVRVAVDVVRLLPGDEFLVQIAGTADQLVANCDQLLVAPDGYRLNGLLIEHTREPGRYSPYHRYLGRVMINHSTYDVPAASFVTA